MSFYIAKKHAKTNEVIDVFRSIENVHTKMYRQSNENNTESLC